MQYTYTFEFDEKDIRTIRNILELKAIEMEDAKNPKAEEIDTLAMIFDEALKNIRKEKELEKVMNHYDEGCKKWEELFAKMK